MPLILRRFVGFDNGNYPGFGGSGTLWPQIRWTLYDLSNGVAFGGHNRYYVRMATFSKNQIRKLREALKLTQDEFAGRLGVKRSAVAHWESGIRQPSGAARILLSQFAAKKNN